MTSHKVDNQKIAKNTIFLYIRMFVILAISFYTSRVVLNALGESDYGTYNVVGGIVVILSFLNSAMMGATQRYLNFELGRQSEVRLATVFWTSVRIHFWIALVVLFLAETVGLWFLNNCMNFAPDSVFAANIVYQCSIISLIATVITVPHNAAIIAHEKMVVFAYISIVEAILKLVTAMLLLMVPSNKLIYYAIFMLATSVIPRYLIYVYSKKHFHECTRSKQVKYSKSLSKELLSFSGWSVFGSLGFTLHTQGIAIIINIFFNTLVNAAQGIATQVNTIVRGFSDNFLQALKPQVIQTYAAGNLSQMHQLIIRGCRLAIYLTAFFVIPILIECESLLALWLKTVPEYTVSFVRIILLISLFDSCSPLLATAQSATGKIKAYQVTLTLIGFLHLPLAALFYWIGYPPQSAFYVYLVLTLVLQVIRVLFVCHYVYLSKRDVLFKIIIRSGLAVLFAAIPPVLIRFYYEPSIISTIVVILTSIATNLISIGIIGLTKEERKSVCSLVGSKLFKKSKNKH